MEFKAAATVVFLLLSLLLMGWMLSKAAQPEEKTIRGIVKTAEEGGEDFVFLTPPQEFDVCEYLGGEPGCGEAEVGVEGGCVMEKEVRHLVRAYPAGENVCVNITVMSSE